LNKALVGEMGEMIANVGSGKVCLGLFSLQLACFLAPKYEHTNHHHEW
jgi:hypothetical protein